MRPIQTTTATCFALALLGAPAAAEGAGAGVGAWLETRGDEAWITVAVKGGAADRAGLRPGASVVAIDGRPIAGDSTEDVNGRLGGPPGSRVELTLPDGSKVALVRDLTDEAFQERRLASWNLRPAAKMPVAEPACLVDLAQAAFGGDGDARARLLKFADGRSSIAATRWLRHAARAGDVEAMYEAGIAARSGSARPADLAEAVRWLEAAQAKDHPIAVTGLAVLGLEGAWRPADPQALVAACERASGFGDAHFDLGLGRLYETGDRLPRSFANARACYLAAAGRSPIDGALALARMTERGQGAKADPVAARRLLEVAWRGLPAEDDRAGDDDVRIDELARALGAFHEEGRGTPRSAEKAATYYLASASSRTRFRGAALLDGLPGAAARARKAYRAAAELAAENDPLGDSLSSIQDAGKEVEEPIVALLDQAGAAGSGDADLFLARIADVNGGKAAMARASRHLERAAAHGSVPAWCRLALDAERRGDVGRATAAYRAAAAAYRSPRPVPAAATDLLVRALQRYDARVATRRLDAAREALWRDAPLAAITTEPQARAYIAREELARWFERDDAPDLWKTPGLRAEERERLLVASLFERKAEVAAEGEALRWRRLAADLGDPTAQLRLGQAHELGLGVARDPAESSFWYELARAADLGFANTAWKGRARVDASLSPGQRADVAARATTWWAARYP